MIEELVRVWAARLRLLVLYRWRRARLSVRTPDQPEPNRRRRLEPVDTAGGIYRPPFRSQFGDSSESHTSSHGEGSNCTMAAAAMSLAYHTSGGRARKPGEMRHAQGDQDGGTDLYDAAEAWASNGEQLSIRSGRGWSSAAADLAAGRGLILQGTGGLAGCGDYTGAHAIYVQPERSGSRWLKGDPECSGWEWCEERDLELFAERLSSTVYYAATADRTSSTPPPEPPPEPPPAPPPCPPAEEHDAAELRELQAVAYRQAIQDRDAAWRGTTQLAQPRPAGIWEPLDLGEIPTAWSWFARWGPILPYGTWNGPGATWDGDNIWT